MSHVANFIHFFSLGLGLISIYIAINLRKRSAYPALRSYIGFLIGLNLVIFLVHFMESILRAIVGDEAYNDHVWIYFKAMIVLFAVLRLFMILAFLQCCYQLLHKRAPRAFVYASAGILLLLVISLFGIEWKGNTEVFVEYGSILLVHLSLGAALIHGSLLLLRQREKADVIHPGLILPVVRFFLIYASLTIVLRIGNLFLEIIPPFIILFGIGLLALGFNGLNVLYLRRVFRMPQPVIQFSDGQLMEKYGITPREQEIIRLICDGKTNKEIATVLFISPITVRDHLSNIFRKTNVKSRTQLAGLFMERPTG